jgi:unsaturated rhamnogalacturonyl hydrolase
MIIVVAVLSCVTGSGQGMRPGAPVLRKRPAAYVRPVTTAIRLAATAMDIWKDSAAGRGGDIKPARWTYEEGVVWLGLMKLWYSIGDARYVNYVRHQVDRLVDKEGNILTYKQDDYSLDNILCGRLLLSLYEVTLQEKYYKAAMRLRQQLNNQPRTREGSFWHKKKYTEQVWLDGIYMALPFYAQYASLFHEDSVFDDITRQFAAIERHVRDPQTGLLYHGWDESGKEKWAVQTSDATSGHSPDFWARAMGWYGMALVDALDYFPAGYPGRDTLLAILQRYAAAVRNVQDPATGLWWDILDRPGQAGNYPEASASAMFVYTLACGVRAGYLPAAYRGIAEKGYRGLVRGEKVVVNDPKGIGTFLMAAVATDELYTSFGTKEKTVLLDYYFNNERRKDITGASVRWRYTWEDRANSGFSLLGQLFRQYGAHTDSLPVAPTADNLKHAGVYIIVDPDDEREVPSPHYPDSAGISSIDDWVKAGGVLVLMSNDSANAEFTHFNVLAGTFGIHFNYDDYHKVIGDKYAMGAFNMTVQDASTDTSRNFHHDRSIFKTTKKTYIKELSTLQLNPPARPYYSDSGHVIMAIARVGRGTVFAVGDPWFYNEYTDGRKLPADYENYNAARDWVRWLLLQAH